MTRLFVLSITQLLAFLACNVRAAIDEQHLLPSAAFTWQIMGNDPIASVAQTFQVRSSGRLTGVDIWTDHPEEIKLPLLFDIRTTVAGVPTEPDVGPNILQSVAVDPGMVSVGRMFPTTFSPDKILHIDVRESLIPVSAGQLLAMTMRTRDPGTPTMAAYGFYGRGSYSGGTIFFRNSLQATSWKSYSGDIFFRTHIHPIPEPSALCLSLLGFAAVFGNRRCR
jgi:hypothetical protein